MNQELRIIEEPRGEVYLSLLLYAACKCKHFSLVWRNQLRFNSLELEIADALEPYLEKNVTTNEWPGTKLIGHMAVVRYYQITAQSLEILKAAPGLFSWLCPDFPEDIAFYSSSGTLWLGTISLWWQNVVGKEESWAAYEVGWRLFDLT